MELDSDEMGGDRLSELSRRFAPYMSVPVALYGLGTETERALAELEGYHIVGLLDGFRQEGMLYSKEIISLQKCLDAQVKLILVVARPGSCRAIANKIDSFCRDHQIALLDVRGKDLLEQKRASCSLEHVRGSVKSELYDEADKAEAVSFDLFDTLIMRKCLLPTDVIELLACRLKSCGIHVDDFAGRRMQAEKELSREEAPFLETIYQSVLSLTPSAGISAQELAEMEWELDCELIIPRREMADILSKFCEQGKQVYIVTDSYYRKDQIVHMLEYCGIQGYTDVLVSCEYRTGKRQRLFSELKTKLQGRPCLHIGDDMAADIESAELAGLQSYRILSAVDMLEQLGYLGFHSHIQELAPRLKLGMLAAKVLNSPFLPEGADKTLTVHNAYEIGYVFMAPMITDFVIWFADRVREKQLNNVWFCARDGYLIKQLYDTLVRSDTSVYFLTSRIAALRSGMDSEEDIQYIAGMKFAGTLSRQLRERFAIVRNEAETEGRDLLDYAEAILEASREKRRNNCRYVQTLPVREGGIAFFDFVAKGTSQMYCSRLVDNHLEGLYFLQLEKEFMKDKKLDICAFYDESERSSSAIYEEYYILETILTSPLSSVLEFDEAGRPCYAAETRSEADIECLMRVQAGITDYFKEYLRLCPEAIRQPEKAVDEMILRLIHGFRICDDAFMSLTVEDPFFNRMTAVKDLL